MKAGHRPRAKQLEGGSLTPKKESYFVQILSATALSLEQIWHGNPLKCCSGSRKVLRSRIGHSATKRHWRNTSLGSSASLWSNKGCNGRGRRIVSKGLMFKARCVSNPPTGSLTSYQAILGARMSLHSVTNTEFSCQQPKNHSLYTVFKENIDLETVEMV